MHTCAVFQLLPGDACEEYCYRYKILGAASSSGDDYAQVVRDIVEKTAAISVLHTWLQTPNRSHHTPAERLLRTGWSGWHEPTGIAFSMQSGETGLELWDWDLDVVRSTQAHYLHDISISTQ